MKDYKFVMNACGFTPSNDIDKAKLPASIRHGKFNIAKAGSGLYSSLHKRALIADILAKIFLNPAMTAGRVANNADGSENCGCQ